MKILFAPSKTMKIKELNFGNYKEIIFPEKTNFLFEKLSSLSYDEIAKIFKIKGKTLDETFENIQNFRSLKEYPAIALYEGVTYRQLEISKFNDLEIEFLNSHLIILSAFYGVLYPNTLIKKYRLDMTVSLLEESLYKFWSKEINNYLDKNYKNDLFLNLSSQEFSKIIDKNRFKVIDVEFRQNVDGKEKNISTEGKKARGSMLNYIVKNKIDNISELENFNIDGYKFIKERSNENTMIFIK